MTAMQRSPAVPDDEPLRAWAASPISSPPPGWGHLLRGGMAAWVRQTPATRPDAPSSSAQQGSCRSIGQAGRDHDRAVSS